MITFLLLDDAQKQTVYVRFKGIPKALLVWRGAAYVAAGDYTQAQVEAAVTTLLGSNPAAFLSTLFEKPPVPPTPAPAAPTAPVSPSPAAPSSSTPPAGTPAA